MESYNNSVEDNREKEVVAVANRRKIRGWDFVLRLLALILALAAAVVLGVDKQTKTVAVQLVPALPPLQIPVPAKMKYLSAFVYFVVANSIACGYAAVSLLLSLANNLGSKKTLSTAIVLFDLIIVALLFSSIGAALSIGLMGYEGNSHVRWDKVCNTFDKFCNQAAAAIGLSAGAAIGFLLLTVLAILNMHKRC